MVYSNLIYKVDAGDFFSDDPRPEVSLGSLVGVVCGLSDTFDTIIFIPLSQNLAKGR